VSRVVVNIAHRGASAYAPENTLAAFELAAAHGADAVELDLHQTKDRRLVVIHDFTLKRTAGDPRQVRSATLAEVQRLSAGAWFHERFSDQRVPTLEQALELGRKRLLLHLELKGGSPYYAEIEPTLLRAIDRARAFNRVRVSSFDEAALARLRGLGGARLALGLLTRRTRTADIIRLARTLRVESVHLSRRRFTPDAARSLRQAGFPVYVYTVDDTAQMSRLIDQGADGLFTNTPDRLAALLQRLAAPPGRD
jgi:glycerophosphoryl diester phosphodiesterase